MSDPAGTVALPLAGRRILVTRPAHQADNLCRLIETEGGQSLRLPLLSVAPPPHAGGLKRLFESARGYDGWIFTSTNAVQYARQLDAGPWPAQLAAVGAATAAALEAGGRVALKPAGQYSSEGLLAMPALQSVAGQRWLIVTGEDGLDALAPALTARGAAVSVAEVYRRVPLPYDHEHIAAVVRSADAAVVTSGQALAHLLRLTPAEQQARLLRIKLVVPGARVVEKAIELGFLAPLAPEKMADVDIVQALIRALASP